VSNDFVIRIPRKVAAAALVVVAALCVAIPLQVRGGDAAVGKGAESSAKVIFTQSLPDIPGKDVTAALVNFPPGNKGTPHRHAGDVFAFVVSGSILSQNSATGPAKVYKAGEAFFEPAGSTHLIGENGSATEPAQLLAVFVADAHAQLTTRQ
jgi:quercetin dioxygenase-like cupin family protein